MLVTKNEGKPDHDLFLTPTKKFLCINLTRQKIKLKVEHYGSVVATKRKKKLRIAKFHHVKCKISTVVLQKLTPPTQRSG